MTDRRELQVAAAEVGAAGAPDHIVALGIGSCVVIVLYDAAACVGGIAHVMLPSPSLARKVTEPGRFPQTALPVLLEKMAALGAQPGRLAARLVGGASMFASLHPPGTIRMGERNLVATRQALAAQAIPIVGEATGGDFGRSARLATADGVLEISSVAHGVIRL